MTRIPGLAAAVAILAAASSAIAHPLPKAASPAPNAVLATSPAEIRITFSEGLIAAFSGLELRDGDGKPVELGAAAVNPHNSKQLAAPIEARLAPGRYTVSWHAVGDDTHHTAGRYSFRVR
jgi:methionine-rich copper-binding protein CopC